VNGPSTVPETPKPLKVRVGVPKFVPVGTGKKLPVPGELVT